MKNLDCIQIEIFINLEIIGEEDKKKNYIYFKKSNKISENLVKPRGATMAFKPNFYYIVCVYT